LNVLALLLALGLNAAPSARLSYETKCLYCHSEEVTEGRRFTEPQWRKLIDQMRRKAPLLITRSDVGVLTRYMTQTLKLVPPRAARPPAPAPVVTDVEPKRPPVVAQPDPDLAPLVPEPEEVTNPVDVALEEQGFALMQRRCSKCHTLSRVYGRLDSFDKSIAVLERMRLKTGSGITDKDLALLQDYLRAQF
jgi:mono/diheme cytochrome c family protein